MLGKIKLWLELIKFEHSAFALPFAYIGALTAVKATDKIMPEVSKLLWITICMIAARSCGMGMNRLADRELDANNPRTCSRALPRGLIPARKVWILVVISALIFLYSAYSLNWLCFKLSPFALFLLFIYSYLKRYTSLTHLSLGLILGIAPLGGWIAITGKLSYEPLILSLAVMFWVAGFDIIYSLLDIEFDRKIGLKSIPAEFGASAGLKVSAYFHLLTILLLVGFGLALNLGIFYWIGIGFAVGFICWQHLIVNPKDFASINFAFFKLNSWLSFSLLIFLIIDHIFSCKTI